MTSTYDVSGVFRAFDENRIPRQRSYMRGHCALLYASRKENGRIACSLYLDCTFYYCAYYILCPSVIG